MKAIHMQQHQHSPTTLSLCRGQEPASRSLPTRQAGLSLVELMISLSIGLFLLLGITALIVQQSSTRGELEKSSRQIENGRYAMQILRDDIQHAGYYGEISSLAAFVGALPDPCVTAPANGPNSLFTAMSLPIQGYNAPSPLPACLSAADYLAGTDILVIRRADTNVLGTPPLVNEVYLQTGFTVDKVPSAEIQYGNTVGFALGSLNADNTVAVVGTKADGTATTILKPANQAATASKNATPRLAANIRKYRVQIYFVSPCSGTNCATSNDGIPTLKRLELTVVNGATEFITVPLVEGIENMQFDYGIAASTTSGSPDSYATDPATIANWENVMAIRVNLLSRNNDPSTGYTDTKQYNMGLAGLTAATNDNFKRHAYTELVRVINPSGRREVP